MNDIDIESLKGIANQLRIHSIAATTAAGSGHPTSCCSAADVVAALFFGHMRYDPKNPHYYNNDRFILSKGHAAPLLYAAWAETGLFPVEDLLKLRQLGSDLEGHPTPRLPFVDVATGSLGQGLSVGVGMALCARLDNLDYRTYVLLGDGECAEGAVWEAASLAGIYQLNNLIAIVDVNRLGQSQATAFGHDLDVYKKRFEAFGWRTEEIDGHDLEEILEVLAAVGLGDQPLVILAKTLKGARRLVPAGQGRLARQAAVQGRSRARHRRTAAQRQVRHRRADSRARASCRRRTTRRPPATRRSLTSWATWSPRAKPSALRWLRIGEADQRVVAMDGDTKNSTYSEKFFKKFPDRFTECFIAEQNMVGVATGFGTRGKVPFASTFACFLHPRLRPDSRGGHFDGEPQARRLARRREHRRGRPVADGLGRPRHDAGDRRQHGAVSQRRRVRGEAGGADGRCTRASASCAPRARRRR